MKRYHKRTKTSLCDSLFWSSRCVHTDCLHFYDDGYKRAEQTLVAVTEEGENNTRNTHQGQNRAVCLRDSIQTLTIRLGGDRLFLYLDLIFV